MNLNLLQIMVHAVFFLIMTSVRALATSLPWDFESLHASSSAPVMPQFSDQSSAAGFPVANSYHYGGPLVTDLNGDGYDDLALNNHNLGLLSIWRQVAGQEKVVSDFEAPRIVDFHGMAPHSFDANRSIKWVIASVGGNYGRNPRPPALIRFYPSLGGGRPQITFDLTAPYGLSQFRGRGRGAAFFDMNGDGHEDLFLNDKTLNNQSDVIIYRNPGNGASWTLFANTAVRHARCSKALGLTDLNNDQILDMFCIASKSNQGGSVSVLKGTGSFPQPFEDVTRSWLSQALISGLAIKKFSSVLELDYNNDGRMDLYLTCGFNFTFGPCDDVLLKNTGSGFIDTSRAAGLPLGGIHSFGGTIGDFNLDGFPDVFIPVYGSPRNIGGSKPNLLLVNRGDGTFQTVTTHGANVPTTSFLRGVGAGGFLLGRSGALNLVVSYDGPQGGPWKFYKNVTPRGGNAFLALEVTRLGFKSPVGARVRVWVGSRVMSSRVGYTSQSFQSVPTRVHFGLGRAAIVDKINVYYVGGGVKTLLRVPAGFRTI
mmetsp:Transcript_2694/g.4898  ORF Transcript_2694/g.4898 Transcript_2694/m.4898 type:complete len:539 (-) Transcript_2694:330-1946(-)